MSGVDLICLIPKFVINVVLSKKKRVMNKTAVQHAMFDLSPTEIRKKIRSVFYGHALIDSENISVRTTGGTVVLTGKVRSWTERKDAEDAAWSIPGVIEVENKLEVQGEVYDGE
jgi:osmotically-inducible protein OsmY